MNQQTITSEIIEKLNSIEGIELKRDIPWKKLTTLGVGKTAPFVAEPQDENSLSELLQFCFNNEIKVFSIGAGSNIAGADKPLDGLIVRLKSKGFTQLTIDGNKVTVGASVSNSKFAKFAAENGLGGLVSISFIPGWIGGSLRMNAGAHGSTISDFLTHINGFYTDGSEFTADKNEIEWNYRSSSLPENVIITQATFTLPKLDQQEEQKKLDILMNIRNTTNAKGRNAGCVFKNPEGTSAGKLIDNCGCKGMSVGDAMVSHEHANFIVNKGNASESDFLELATTVKKMVLEKTGIYLEPEVQCVDQDSKNKLNFAPVTVAVLKGGTSSERDVSLESGGAVANALRQAGYNVLEVDLQALEITEEMKRADVIFPVLHGGFGENGELQKLMEDADLEFVGCGSKACQTIMDKVSSKEIMAEHGIGGAKDVVLENKDYSFPEDLKLPVVTKPPKDGSSFGLSLVSNMEEWKTALELAYKYDSRLLVEEYVKGVEITVGVIDGKPLSAVEIDYPGMMYDFDAKYTYKNGQTFYHCPPKHLSEEVHKRCQHTAVKFFNAVGARDVTRVDMLIDKNDNIHVLEGNNLPGFTASSLLPKSAKQQGMSFVELCAKLVQCAVKRKKASTTEKQ